LPPVEVPDEEEEEALAPAALESAVEPERAAPPLALPGAEGPLPGPAPGVYPGDEDEPLT